MKLIAQELNKLLDKNWVMLGIEMSLALEPSIVNQVVGIRNHSGDCSENMVIDLVQLSRFTSWNKELGDFFLFSSEDYTVLSQNTNDRTILVDVLNGVLNLEESSIWVKSGGSLIVFA
jgi:hypothetical protein